MPAVLSQVMNAHLAGFSQDEWLQLLGLLRRVVSNGAALRDGKCDIADSTREAD